MRAFRNRIAGLAAALAAIAPAAGAVTCSLDIERAYQEALKRGWAFDCHAVLSSDLAGVTFDGSKQVGCYGKAGARSGTHLFEARFFRKGISAGADFRSGWRLDSFQVIGGSFSRHPSTGGTRVVFSWAGSSSNTHTRRFLTKLILRKAAGNCTAVYDEAFG